MAGKFIKAVLPSVVLPMAAGQIYAFTVFSDDIAHHISSYDNFVTTSQVQFAFSLGIFFLGLGAACFGGFVERHTRLSTLFGTTLFVFGLLVTEMGVVDRSIRLIYAGYGFLVGTGTGILYISPVKTMMLWFRRNKALAAALPIVMFGLGSSVTTLIYGHIGGNGITYGFTWLAMLYAAPMYAASLMIDRPGGGVGAQPPDARAFSYRRTLADPRFVRLWTFMFLNISCGLCLIPLAKQMMARDAAGFSEQTIAALVLLQGLVNAGGRLVFVWLSDRLANRVDIMLPIVAIPLVTMGASLFPSAIGLVMLVVIACFGAGFAVIPAVIADLYGLDDLSKVHGAVLSAWGVAGLVGNQLSILVSDRLGFGNVGVIALLMTLYALNYLNACSLRNPAVRPRPR